MLGRLHAVVAKVSEATRGITDITNSESKLHRLIEIAFAVAESPRPILAFTRIMSQMNVSNASVVGRHLRLATQLGLVNLKMGKVSISGVGRALVALDSTSGSSKPGLSSYDRVFFAIALFREAPVQLMHLLRTIEQEQGRPASSIVIQYFADDGHLPWQAKTVEKNLEKYRETGHVPRLFEHKVSCMIAWMKDLGLVEQQGPYRLATPGREVLALWREEGHEFLAGMTHVAGKLLGGEARDLPSLDADTRERLARMVADAATMLQTELGMAAYDEVRFFATARLLVKDKIAIESDEFETLTKTAWRQGLIRSVVLGRDGSPSQLVAVKPR
jgi:hypothetical protein